MLAGHSSLAVTQRYIEGDGGGEDKGSRVGLSYIANVVLRAPVWHECPSGILVNVRGRDLGKDIDRPSSFKGKISRKEG